MFLLLRTASCFFITTSPSDTPGELRHPTVDHHCSIEPTNMVFFMRDMIGFGRSLFVLFVWDSSWISPCFSFKVECELIGFDRTFWRFDLEFNKKGGIIGDNADIWDSFRVNGGFTNQNGSLTNQNSHFWGFNGNLGITSPPASRRHWNDMALPVWKSSLNAQNDG